MYAYPKKRFGQHFLIDRNVLEKIVLLADVRPGDAILEVGPGRGALTEVFLAKGADVIAIEVDRNLAATLRERFSGLENFELMEADALKVSFVEISRRVGRRLKVVSNLPYNISGPIVAKFMEEREAFTGLVLMLQKEVAMRLASEPGTKDYGALTVLTRAFADAEREFDVQPGSFRPRPKVTSSVVSMRILKTPRIGGTDPALFRKVVRSAFAHRRKTLRNSLKTLGLEPSVITDVLASCGIDPGQRGETLTVEEFAGLTDRISGITDGLPAPAAKKA